MERIHTQNYINVEGKRLHSWLLSNHIFCTLVCSQVSDVDGTIRFLTERASVICIIEEYPTSYNNLLRREGGETNGGGCKR